VALAAVTPFTGSYLILLITQALILGILAMSLDILLGFTGLPSLGQAAYLGMGAYLTAILAAHYDFGLGWSFLVVVVLGILIGAVTAAFFGLFAIRATGVYFLMITLALGMCVWGLAYRWNSMTGAITESIFRHGPNSESSWRTASPTSTWSSVFSSCRW